METKISIKGAKFFEQSLLEKSLFSNLLLVEQPPQYRTILTSGGLDKNFLLFPYIVYGIHFCSDYESNRTQFINLSVGFSTASIKIPADHLMKLPLSNFDCYNVCTENFNDIYASSVEELVQKVISYFWESPFDAIGNLPLWKSLTKDDLKMFETICSYSTPIQTIFHKLINKTIIENDQEILMRI